MDKPYPGMDKRKSKSEELFLKEKNPKSPIVKLHRYPKFGQIPQELLRNPEIKLQSKAIYGILHTIAEEKDLTEMPTIFKSGVSIAKEYAGISKTTFERGIKELEKYGWATNIRRGLGKSNIILLHWRKTFLGKSTREFEKNRVEKEIQNWKDEN